MNEEELKSMAAQMNGQVIINEEERIETGEDDLFELESEAPAVTEEAVSPVAEEKKEEVTSESLDDILNGLGLNDDVTTSPETKIQEEIVTGSSLNVESLIKEKTNGAYSSIDEILAKLNESPFANDQIKKLNDLAKSGKDIMKVLEMDKLNVEHLDPSNTAHAFEIIKSKLKKDEPEITDRELNFLLKKYTYNEDVDSEEDIEIKKIQMERDARSYKKELVEYKKELELPSPSINNNNSEYQEKLNQLQKEWEQKVDADASKYSTLKINVGEKTLDFQIKDEMRNDLVNLVKNPNNLWKEYTNSAGVTDINKLMSDMVRLKHQEAIQKTIYDQGFAQGQRDLGLKIKNSRNTKGETKSVETGDSLEKQVARQMRNF